MDDGPIDESVLRALRRVRKTSQDFPSTIIALYLDTTPGVLKELETAALADDISVLRTANHRLLSSSVAVGAVRLVGMSQKLDELVRSGAMPDAVERVAAIAKEYVEVEAALLAWTAAEQGNL